MKLSIDTTLTDVIKIKIDDQTFEAPSRQDKSQKLLSFIDETLTSIGKTPKDLTEIEVNTGPGSFTGIRVGVAVANAMAYVLKIPVNGKNTETDIKYE
jgi:tRNA threonylcarbamoyladenosine biosynthesis protein TsaB